MNPRVKSLVIVSVMLVLSLILCRVSWGYSGAQSGFLGTFLGVLSVIFGLLAVVAVAAIVVISKSRPEDFEKKKGGRSTVGRGASEPFQAPDFRVEPRPVSGSARPVAKKPRPAAKKPRPVRKS